MQVITQYGVHKVFWNKVYSPEQFDLDVQVISLLSEKNIRYETYNASLMWEPSQILNQSDLPYKVFTPFFKKGCLYSMKDDIFSETGKYNGHNIYNYT